MKLLLSSDDILESIINRIHLAVQNKNWSLVTLAEESGVPYDTVKKFMTHKIAHPQMQNILRIAYALEIDLNTLLPASPIATSARSKFAHDTKTSLYLSEIEKSLLKCESTQDTECVPVYTMLGLHKSDRTHIDSYSIDMIPLGKYKERFGDRIACGIRLSTTIYHPVYYRNDILLIGRDRLPLAGETGVFINNGGLLIRKYNPGPPITLSTVNHIGKTLTLSTLDDWYIFGYVLTVYR